ncbi:uncharacterized protein LOC133171834 [Saccostrea echinata]|uniref:uncharacterized protein LOC133171834 n=1 Tax=Saccostrea echinata TaxID=191078 RepID=UPI002A7F5ADA|nr:uncharacterized protein LOC133171834 [Saccostrea echinata]
MFLEDCDGNYRYYSPYMYSYNNYSSSGGLIGGIMTSIGFSIIILFTIICCCCKGSKANTNTRSVMYLHSGNQQRIVTSNRNVGIHYPAHPDTANSAAGVYSPAQLSSYYGQYNTAFQYGIELPDQKFDTAPLPPSYESVVDQNRVMPPPYPTQEENASNMTDPPPYKA